MKAIIVTGTRDWTDAAAIYDAIDELAPDAVLHGCARGADGIADEACRVGGYSVIPMPAQWDRDGKAAGPIRNRAMLSVLLALRDCGYRVAVLAFPLPDSRGTYDMMRAAREAGVKVFTWSGKLVEWTG